MRNSQARHETPECWLAAPLRPPQCRQRGTSAPDLRRGAKASNLPIFLSQLGLGIVEEYEDDETDCSACDRQISATRNIGRNPANAPSNAHVCNPRRYRQCVSQPS